ncbi:ubiquitin carboxyl-terminal hydrolase 38 [Drosophila grimshawi]|uniref:GH19918 n=1 Tax=Drosophila grimshawi TaxID=7222 RepID=B4J8V0_DROGR|nr:ubiquitin carboxyl-terminal hydrolase 38 [Drosophila grimshawi]EDW02390.1 GH19918 [Drosophila grimshawi]
MAVKQNNTEQQNDGAPGGGGGAGADPATATSTSNVPGSNNNISDKGGGSNDASNGSDASPKAGGSDSSDRQHDIKALLRIMQIINPEEQQATLVIYHHVICKLARMPMSTKPEDLKRFKEEINKVGNYLAMPNKKSYLMFYLRIVYQLITETAYEPSCAVAIVFQLFSPDLIIEAVQSLLDQDVQDDSIRKTVGLLCKWICFCNFCQNLNLWIMALLQGLREQEKYLLLDEIALDNIEMLFWPMILPAMRPKVAPVVFHMLSTINQAPEIFHKILPKIPPVINSLKNQSNSMDESSYLQKMVDLTNALMMRFYDNDELYAPIKAALQMYEPSQNCVVLARALFENALPRNARVGLVNLGNTCYMNSVLQALAMTSDFVRQILLIESGSLLLLKVQQQIALMHHSMRYELTPSRVLKATRPPGFTPGLQQDSSEFLGYLLDLLHEHEINSGAHNLQHMDTDVVGGHQAKELKDASEPAASLTDEIVAAGVIPYNSNDHEICAVHNSRPNAPGAISPATPTATPTNAQQKKPPSTIDKTFAGKLSTTYKCLNCGWESRNEDSFRELQLSFPDDKDDCGAANYSVQDLIDYYCSPEKLDGDNQYFCPRCKKLCDAERRIGITQAPRNLILTLKQFKYDQKYHFRTKLMHKVFHDESVNVKVCSTDSLQETCTVHYDLYAGVVHAGYSMDSGHYFTFAADQSKNWFKFNDSLVTNSKPQEMHSLTSPNTPYILFYQMCGRSTETAPDGPMHPMVPVPLIPPLTLDELPRTLRDYVKQDNRDYNEELKMQRFKRNAKRNNVSSNGTMTRNGYDGDDEDDQSPPPAGGCGGPDLAMNMNRFVY